MTMLARDPERLEQAAAGVVPGAARGAPATCATRPRWSGRRAHRRAPRPARHRHQQRRRPAAGHVRVDPEEAWLDAFELSLHSAIRLTRLALPHLESSGRGRVVNITSWSVREPIPNLILSNTIRPGVVGWAKTLVARARPRRDHRQHRSPRARSTRRACTSCGRAARPRGGTTATCSGPGPAAGRRRTRWRPRSRSSARARRLHHRRGAAGRRRCAAGNLVDPKLGSTVHNRRLEFRDGRTCYRHPDRETALSCSNCGRPICPECMTHDAGRRALPGVLGQASGDRRAGFTTSPTQPWVTYGC